MESTTEELRSKREYYMRRINVTCDLTEAQMNAAVDYLCSVQKCTRQEAEQELIRQRFCWDSLSNHAVSGGHLEAALLFKHNLLNAIECVAPLRNPCTDCYQKSPEAKAEKRKLAMRFSDAPPKKAPATTTAGGASGKGKKVKLASDLPAVTSDNTVVGRTLPDA